MPIFGKIDLITIYQQYLFTAGEAFRTNGKSIINLRKIRQRNDALRISPTPHYTLKLYFRRTFQLYEQGTRRKSRFSMHLHRTKYLKFSRRQSHRSVCMVEYH